jgi:enamine deaminase RidA (YjgF/YER057c/UK114 family)/diacylglycerol kinase family enzyme
MSGGGKAERFALAEEAQRRGIEYVIIGPGDDLRRLAEEAADRGADALGVAGGDGSQAVAAQVAMERDLAFVCVPSGTRNHFARDIGLDPADPIGSLAAFGEAQERRIDLGVAGDRVFVNNVSLGVYALLVRTPGYRESKPRTAAHVLPAVLGPDAEPVDLLFTGPDGREQASYQLILVSNGPYDFTADPRFGSREGIDNGVLGIVAAKAGEGDDYLQFAGAWWTRRSDPRMDGSSGGLPNSTCARVVRSQRGWTARPRSSTRLCGSGACRAPFGYECPPGRQDLAPTSLAGRLTSWNGTSLTYDSVHDWRHKGEAMAESNPRIQHHLEPAGMAPGNGYSHAVVAAGRVVAIAGQVAMDDRGELVGADDPRAQAERVFENLRLALAAAGATFADVVKFGVFTTDISILPVVREVRDRYVATDRPPASTAVQVAALFRPGYVLEVEALAVVA